MVRRSSRRPGMGRSSSETQTRHGYFTSFSIRVCRPGATAVVSSRDGMMLGAAWEDGTVIVWDVPSRAPLDQFQHSSAVQSMAFAPDGRTVATGSEDGQLHVRVLASKTSLALHRHGRQSAHVGP